MEKLNNDELFLICKQLELKDLLNFCKLNKKIKNKIYKKDIIWNYKLNILNENGVKGIEKFFENFHIKPRKVYIEALSLIEIKRKLKISEDIYEFSHKIELCVRGFCIKEIPKEIGNLSNLQKLDLSYNSIKEIPKEIGNLSNLQILDLDNNKIKEIPIEICNLSKLRNLYLYYNEIKEIPKEIGNLSNLQYLYLQNNQIEEIPKELGKMKNLKELHLNNNFIKEIPKEIDLKNLRLYTLPTHITFE